MTPTASTLTISIAGPVQVLAGALTVNTPPPVTHGRRTGVFELYHGMLINLVMPKPRLRLIIIFHQTTCVCFVLCVPLQRNLCRGSI